MSFKLRTLTLAVATFSAMTAHSAGLDRSGQDITAFLQDGDYADIIYTHIDADIKGKDTANREVKDIAPSYDFFRYNVKTDINDRISVGVLYDEPFGAKVQYEGVNNFTGGANVVAIGTIQNVLGSEQVTRILSEANLGVAAFTAQAGAKTGNEQQAYTLLAGLLSGTANNITAMQTASKDLTQISTLPATVKARLEGAQTQAQRVVSRITTLISNPSFNPEDKKNIEEALQKYSKNSQKLSDMNNILNTITTDNGGTNVEIHTRNLTGLVGVKLGEKKNIQVYAGPAFQKLEGEVHLRGNTYRGATGYDAKITPDTAIGWVAGVSYSKPEIALKASLTYRSEIEHSTPIQEALPLAPLRELPAEARGDFKVTLPESYNLDFQTGLSAKHRLLGTVKVRYVPWGDFAITPPLYNQASKLNIVDYAKDQWSAEVGLGKQVNDKLAVSGSVGWDSGAGNPATSLGPVKGYYSLGLGAKYNITQNWALSAGAKYLKFGDATAQLPDKTNVGEFKDNDGYIVGLKLSYQKK